MIESIGHQKVSSEPTWQNYSHHHNKKKVEAQVREDRAIHLVKH